MAGGILVEQVNWRDIYKPLLAEFIGCFFINLLACSAAISTDDWGYTLTPKPPGTFSFGDTYHMSVSLAFGFIFSTVFAMFQHVSGAHMNPAVTLAMMLGSKTYFLQGLLYIPVQVAGCLCGSAFLSVIMGKMNAGRWDVFPTIVNRAHGVKEWQGLLWEVVITFVLVLMYFAVTDDDYPMFGFTAPLLVGAAVIIDTLAALYATGASANPARSLGAAIVSYQYRDIWIYIIGPPVGAVIATGFYFLIMWRARELQEKDEAET